MSKSRQGQEIAVTASVPVSKTGRHFIQLQMTPGSAGITAETANAFTLDNSYMHELIVLQYSLINPADGQTMEPMLRVKDKSGITLGLFPSRKSADVDKNTRVTFTNGDGASYSASNEETLIFAPVGQLIVPYGCSLALEHDGANTDAATLVEIVAQFWRYRL